MDSTTMNTLTMNSIYNFESYNFPTIPYQEYPLVEKFNYHDDQVYLLQTEPEFHHGYSSIVTSVSDIPVVPSQTHVYNNIPSSPESMNSPLSTAALLSPTTDELSLIDKVQQRIPDINQLPNSLLPEFHQYSREIYENNESKKRGYHQQEESSIGPTELRRQVHIRSEQKRRAQIKTGFDTLRQQLPGCLNKKLSKATLLKRTVQHLQYLKKNQASILNELKKLVEENEKLKQQNIYNLS